MDREDRLLQERLDKLKASDDPVPTDSELLERLNRLKNVTISSETLPNPNRKLILPIKDKRSEAQKVDDLLKELNCEVELNQQIRNIVLEDDDNDENSEASSLPDDITDSEPILTSESELSESESEPESCPRTNKHKIAK